MTSAVRRALAPALVYVGLTLALVWPLLGQFASGIPHDAGDPVLNTWLLWWSSRAVPLTSAWWNAPMFYPARSVMALSEVLIGLLPIALPVQWLTGQPQAAYNAAFVLSFPLSALAAYVLAFELTGRRGASFVAGLAFMFAPYRMSQLGHLQMLAYYGAPLAFAALHRVRRTGSRKALVAFGAAWLLQSLSNGYAMFHLGVAIAAWMLWFGRSRRVAVPVAVAWAAASLPLLPVLLEYRAVQGALHLARSINDIKSFGAGPADFLSASADVWFWGSRLLAARPETALFPGVTIIAVAIFGIAVAGRTRAADRLTAPPAAAPTDRPASALDRYVWTVIALAGGLVALSVVIAGPWAIGPLTVSGFHKPLSIALAALLVATVRSVAFRQAWRAESVAVFYVALAVGAYLLALGPEPRIFDRPLLYEPPYAWLMRLPGFDAMRVPARFAMIAVMAQSVLVALVVSRLRADRTRRLAAGTLALGIALDGWTWLTVAPPPKAGPEGVAAAAIAEMPVGEAATDFGALYRQMRHGLPIVNGYSGYNPPHYLALAQAIRDGRFEVLRAIGSDQPVAATVDLTTPGAEAIVATLTRTEGATRVADSGGWAVFLVAPQPHVDAPLGPRLTIAHADASHQAQDIAHMFDGRVDTAWGTGGAQRGDETVTLDLGERRPLGALVMPLGPFAFGYPQRLSVEISDDGQTWTPAWDGPTSVLTVRAALRDPGAVPLRIDLDGTPARFVRLRQLGTESGVPWWIAELQAYAAP